MCDGLRACGKVQCSWKGTKSVTAEEKKIGFTSQLRVFGTQKYSQGIKC